MSRPATDTAPAAATETPRPRALLPWRMLAMVYDALPVLALWMLAGTLFTLAYTFSGHAQRENIAPQRAADRIAESRILSIGKLKMPLGRSTPRLGNLRGG